MSEIPVDERRTTGEVSPTTVTVRYFAAARAASGVDSEELTLRSTPTVSDALDAAVARHGDKLQRVLRRCSYLRNAVAVHDEHTVLQPGDEIDVLPPFAGG